MLAKELFEHTEWYQTIQQYEHILVFGTKTTAVRAYNSVLRCGKDIECFVVSNERKAGKPPELSGKPIKAFCEIPEEWKRRGLIVITQYDGEAMRDILRKAGFQNVVIGPFGCSRIRLDELSRYSSTPLGPIDLGNTECVSDYCRRTAASTGSGELPSAVHRMACIYAVTSHLNRHTAAQKRDSAYVKYIQAGSACTDQRICEIRDDEGDNISIQNPYYCELTAGYWIYKNDHAHSYVGLYHYSRCLDLTDRQIELAVAGGVDMVLPVPFIFSQPIVVETAEKSLNIILEAIRQSSPEYLPGAQKYWSGRIFFPGNIIFAKKEVFDHYYAWMFNVIDECAKILRREKIEVSRRMWGYYAESLSSIYFQHHAKNYFTLYAPMSDLL